MSAAKRSLWRCPHCSRTFATKSQVHTCRPPIDLEEHFINTEASVRQTFNSFVDAARDFGPFEIVPQRTRIALHARMSFAALMPRRRWLKGHLVLAERVETPVFHRITTYSKRNHVHEFQLKEPQEIDHQFRTWIGAAYDVGMQRHHNTARPPNKE